MRFKLLFFTLFCMLAAVLPVRAEELTVYDGEVTNDRVPIYSFYCDSYLKCEYVIPAEELRSIAGGTITGLTWYLNETASYSWGNANFEVFLKEVDSNTLSTYIGAGEATAVYQGALDGMHSPISINFTTPYSYEGGSLLVGVYNTQMGSWGRTATFYGQSVPGACVQGYSRTRPDDVTATQCNFIPKTTFTYTPAVLEVTNFKPTNVQVSNITTHGATVSWNRGYNETSWMVEYKASDGGWTSAGEVDTTFIDIDGLTNGIRYDVRVKGVYYGGVYTSDWATATFATEDCEEVDKCEVTYDLYDAYGDTWTGNYLQIVNHNNGAVVANLTVTNQYYDHVTGIVKLAYGVDYDLVWAGTNYSYHCGFTVKDPHGVTLYEHEGHEKDTDEGATPIIPGTLLTFQIQPDQFPKPTYLEISDITAQSAKATWIGKENALGYNLRYKELALSGLSNDFDNLSLNGWTTIDADGDGYGWVLGTQVGGIYLEGDWSMGGQGHSPQDLVVSGSASNIAGNLHPDNYLVSPKVILGGTISFWAKGQDHDLCAEVFGVAVSTTGRSNPADFTMVGEKKTATADWVLYEFDLSEYAGQDGFVAIRHYDVSGQFLLDVDDITITPPSSAEETPWIIVNDIDSTSYEMTALEAETPYEVQVQAAYADGNSEWTKSVNFTTTINNTVPFDMAVTNVTPNSATVTWEGYQVHYNLRYRQYVDPLNHNSLWNFPIVNGIVQGGGWHSVDHDGDGHGWIYEITDSQLNDAYLSSASGLDEQDGGALTPDNWFVSPIVKLGGTFKFKAWRSITEGDILGVYVSQDGNENLVQVGQDFQPNEMPAVYEFDLSGFEGTGKIIIRHYNCSDKYRVFIDDFELTVPNPQEEYPWTTVNSVESPYTIGQLELRTEYEVQVQGVLSNQTTTNWTNSVKFTTLGATVGDVNGDGDVNSVDVTLLYNFLLNGDMTGIVNGDQDGDGIITTTDITSVYNVILGN